MKSPKTFGLLTKFQCCTTGDGVVTAVVASEKFVRTNGLKNEVVEILAMEMVTDFPPTLNERICMLLATVGLCPEGKCGELIDRGDNTEARQIPGAALALQHDLGARAAIVIAIYRLGFPEYAKL
ncbi:Scpx [Trypoxylus dichotomus]